MSCCHPIPALDLGSKVNKEGATVRNIKLLDMRFKHINFGLEELKEKYGDRLILLPCGKCYGCACDYAKTWSNRIMLEASLYGDNNSFLTLTYSDEFLPDKLEKRPLQLFMKRLRKEVGSVRFFACGELGEGKGSRQDGNPHYHIIIFGYSFPDKYLFQKSSSGMLIYRSPLLERLWPYGMSSIGTVTPESAQYVAKYSLKKKLTGQNSGEFVLMSRRPGIGRDAYSEDFWLTDRIYLNGHSSKPPRFFEKIAVQDNCFSYVIAKDERLVRQKKRLSSKYLYGLVREEDALKLENDFRIFHDCLKVRCI